MTKQFKVGDKVRILGKEGIDGGHDLTNGNTYEVNDVDDDGWIRLNDDLDDGVWISTDEFNNIEKVSDKPTKNQRIMALESEVATLKAELSDVKKVVEAMKKAQLPDYSNPVYSEYKGRTKSLTPNQARKAIIDEAKAFVAKYSGVVKNNTTPYTTQCGDTEIRLFVNAEKRIVTAIPRLVHARFDVHSDKKFAKCAPDDVFNADFGKAIALGRALGLDVARFEQAVKPTEVVVGQKVSCGEDSYYTARNGIYTVVSVPQEGFEVGGAFVDAFNNDRRDKLTWIDFRDLKISDDTEAQYE